MPNKMLISRLSDYLSAHMGLYFPEKRWAELEQKMLSAMKDFDFAEVEEFIRWLLSAPLSRQQIEALAGHLSVKETYFFRENKIFEVLERLIFPELIKARHKTEKRIRIWSAGCSTGEEAYSIAILLNRLIPDIRDWNITILATDINPSALQKAKKGIYSEWSFRETSQRIKDEYFNKVNGGNFEIRSPIKEMVFFSYLNLSEDVYPSLPNNTNAMDLILCRNVLMYFAPEYAAEAVQRLHRCLIEGSFLIVSVVEVSSILSSQFKPVRFQDVTIYKKDGYYLKTEKKTEPLTEKEAASYPLYPIETRPPKPAKPLPVKKTDGSKTIHSKSTIYEQASVLYNQGYYQEAEEKLIGLLSGNQDKAKSIILFAHALANQGKLADALHWCGQAISADKLNPGLHYLYATILEEQGKSAEATLSLNKAIYLDPDFILAHFALGNLMQRLGKQAEKRKCFRNTAELLSKSKPEEIVPESEGLTAGRLFELLRFINI